MVYLKNKTKQNNAGPNINDKHWVIGCVNHELLKNATLGWGGGKGGGHVCQGEGRGSIWKISVSFSNGVVNQQLL